MADMQPSTDRDAPSTFPFPPVLLVGAIAIALAFDRWIVPLPMPLAETGLGRLAGWLLLLGGVGLAVWAALAFRAHETSIRPDRGSNNLITSGPFALSRNPIYLGEVLALVGAALAFNRLSLAFVAPFFALAVWQLAIRREEAYLDRRFGEAYRAYRGRVRRWV